MTFESRSGLDPKCVEVARAVRDAGGRALVVGGWVRDHLLGVRSKDVDIEVHGLDVERIESILAGFGNVHAVGRAFGVFRVGGIDVDFSLPRRDSKRGPGHRGFDVTPDPSLDFAQAARRRDLTVNSIGIDPLTGEVLDPHGGRRDLERRVLRATDPERFPEDPLRGLRVAQLAARLEMAPDEELLGLCRSLDLSELSGERVFDEEEVQGFFEVYRVEGACAGHLHVEMTGRDVTECVGGVQEISDEGLAGRCHTHCDPRLDARQSIETAFRIAQMLREERGRLGGRLDGGS